MTVLTSYAKEGGMKRYLCLLYTSRQLFYTIASSYITLYLAIVFLVVANTIVGVQFLKMCIRDSS